MPGFDDDVEIRGLHGVKTAYKFRASRDSTQAMNDAAFTLVIFDDETYDPNSNYNSTTGVYTVPVTGYYLVTAAVSLDVGGDIDIATIAVYKNGAELSRGTRVGALTVDQIGLVYSDIVLLTATNTIDIRIYQDNTANTTRNVVAEAGHNHFAAHLLSV